MMEIKFIHSNRNFFPQAETMKNDRWLRDAKKFIIYRLDVFQLQGKLKVINWFQAQKRMFLPPGRISFA